MVYLRVLRTLALVQVCIFAVLGFGRESEVRKHFLAVGDGQHVLTGPFLEQGIPAGYVAVPDWALCLILVSSICICSCCLLAWCADHRIDASLFTKIHKAAFKADSNAEVRWVNHFVEIIWPHVEGYTKNVLKETVEPLLAGVLPVAVTFRKVSLGTELPKAGPVKVRQRGDDTAVIDVTINADLAVNVDIHGLGFSFGVNRILFSGEVTVVFRPLTHEVPWFFGGLEIYFSNPPELDLTFTGVGEIVDMVGIRGKIRKKITEAINSYMVLPSRIGVDLLDDDVDYVDLSMPRPVGILRLTLKSARKLRSVSHTPFFTWHGEQSANPYVIVNCGQSSYLSPIIKDTLSPVWSDQNVFDLVVYDDGTEKVSLKFYDDGSPNDVLGAASDLPVSQFSVLSGVDRESRLALWKDKTWCGEVVVSTTWLKMGNPPLGPLRTQSIEMGLGGRPSIIFFAKILSLKGVLEDSKPPFTVQVSVGNSSCKSKPSSPDLTNSWAWQWKKDLCQKMYEQQVKPKSIAKVLDLTEDLVDLIIKMNKASSKAESDHLYAEYMEHVSETRSKLAPKWDELMKMFLQEGEADGTVVLDIIDKMGSSLGQKYEVKLSTILETNDGELSGPFRVGDVELVGVLRAHRLTVSSS